MWRDFPIRWSSRHNFLWGISLDQKEHGRQAALYNNSSSSLQLSCDSQKLLDRKLATILDIDDTLSVRSSLCQVGRGKRENGMGILATVYFIQM